MRIMCPSLSKLRLTITEKRIFMRKKWFLWGSILILLALAACGPVGGVTTFSGAVGGLQIELTHPADWTVDAQPDLLQLATDAALFDTEAETAVTDGARVTLYPITSSNLADPEDLTGLLQREIDALRAVGGQSIREEITAVTINDQPAATVTLDSIDGSLVYRGVVISGGENIALIFAELNAAEEETLLPAVEDILNSITLSSLTQ